MYPGPGAAPLVALLHLDQPRLLQHGQVPGQVARRQPECVAQVSEVGPRLGGDGKDPQAVPLVDGIVEPVRGMRGRVSTGLAIRLLRAHARSGLGRRKNAPAPATPTPACVTSET